MIEKIYKNTNFGTTVLHSLMIIRSRLSGTSLAIIVFLAYLLTLSIPLTIYLGNKREFIVHFNDFLPVLLIAFVLFTSLLLIPLAIPIAKFRRLYIKLLLAISLLAWTTSSFFYGDFILFNGGTLELKTDIPKALFSSALWLLVITLILFNRKLGSLAKNFVLAVFAVLICVDLYRYSAIYNTPSTLSGLTLESKLKSDSFEKMKVFSSERNVLHIILDELQSDIFTELLESETIDRNIFRGFYYFPNTAGIYPYTQLSLPAMLSGEVYKNKSDKQAYLRSAFRENNFFDALLKKGYNLNFHIHATYCGPAYLDFCSAPPLFSSLPAAIMLLDFSMFRAAPYSLRTTIRSQGNGSLKQLFEFKHQASSQGMGYLLFTELNDGFAVADIPPTYKLFHSLISHAPILLDQDCQIVDEILPNDPDNIKAQSMCALQLTAKLLQNLKESGIYDKTLIVISSDHGGHYAKEDGALLRKKNIAPKDFQRARATLLIKPFNSNNDFTVSDYPARLSDIPKTLSEVAKLDAMLSGENVFSPNNNPHRERYFFTMDWSLNTQKGSKLDGFGEYLIKGDVRDIDSWQRLQ